MNTKLELTIKNTEQRCKLTDLDINVNITGFLSKTSVTMTFLNEIDLDSEGELVFPMPEGAAISGYAVDINGELVDGVVVEKEKARITFEAEARSVEKPSASIVEHVVGNVFRTRITPLPKKATRIIRVAYVEELTPISKSQQNRSANKNQRDVQWKMSLENIGPLNTLAVNAIIAGGGAPRARFDGSTIGTIKPLPDVIGPVAWRFKSENCTIKQGFEIDVPGVASQIVEVDEDKQQYFVLNDDFSAEFNFNESVVQADRVALLWDASKSREVRNEKDVQLIKTYVQKLSNITVDLIVFRDTSEDLVTFKLVNGNASPLIDYLNKIPYIGGSNLGQLSVTKTVPVQIKDGEEIVIRDTYNYYLMFTDGLHNLSLNTIPEKLEAPVYIFSSSTLSDGTLLKVWARKSGGEYFDLNSTSSSTSEIVSKLGNTKFQYLFAEIDGAVVSEIYPSLPSPIQGKQFTIAGKINGQNSATIALNYGYGTRVTRRMKFQINPASALKNNLAARYWAQKKIDELQLFPEVAENEAKILSIGQQYNIVTPNSSLIVLESLDQYVKYEIEPPKSLPDVRKNYLEIMKNRKQQQLERDNEKILSVVSFWQRRVAWWNEDVTSPEHSEPQIQHHFQFGFFKPDVHQVAPKDVLDLKQADLNDALQLKIVEDEEETQRKALERQKEEEEMRRKALERQKEEEEMRKKALERQKEEEEMRRKALERQMYEEEVRRKKLEEQEMSHLETAMITNGQVMQHFETGEQDMIAKRDEEIKLIEQELHQINEMFLDMNKLVTDQSQRIEHIDSNVDSVGRWDGEDEIDQLLNSLSTDAPQRPVDTSSYSELKVELAQDLLDEFLPEAAAALPPMSPVGKLEYTKSAEYEMSEDEDEGYGLFADDDGDGGGGGMPVPRSLNYKSMQSAPLLDATPSSGISNLFDFEPDIPTQATSSSAYDISSIDPAFTASDPFGGDDIHEQMDYGNEFEAFTYTPPEPKPAPVPEPEPVVDRQISKNELKKKAKNLATGKRKEEKANEKASKDSDARGKGRFDMREKEREEPKSKTNSFINKLFAKKEAPEPDKPVLRKNSKELRSTETKSTTMISTAKPVVSDKPAAPKPPLGKAKPVESNRPAAAPKPSLPSAQSVSLAGQTQPLTPSPPGYGGLPPIQAAQPYPSAAPSAYPMPQPSFAPSAAPSAYPSVPASSVMPISTPVPEESGQERFRTISTRNRASGGQLDSIQRTVEESESIGLDVMRSLQEQRQSLDSIEENISSAGERVPAATTELKQASEYQKSGSWFGVLKNIKIGADIGLLGGKKSKQRAYDVPTTIPTIGFNSEPVSEKRSRRHNAARVQKDIDNVKEVMNRNIDRVLSRGEKLEDLVLRSDDLQYQAQFFRQSARKMKSSAFGCGPGFFLIFLMPIIFLVKFVVWVLTRVKRVLNNSVQEYDPMYLGTTTDIANYVPLTKTTVTEPVYFMPTLPAVQVETPSDEYFSTLLKAQDEVQTQLHTAAAPEPETDTTVNKTEKVDPKMAWVNWHARQAQTWKEFEQKHFTTGLCFMQKWNEVRVGQLQRVLERELKRVDEEFNSTKTDLAFYKGDERKTASMEVCQKWKSKEFYMSAIETLDNTAEDYQIHAQILYIQKREHVHEKLSSFYIDAAQFLFGRGRIHEGATILSTLAEIDFENPQLLRAMAMNTDHIPQLDHMTEALYRQILKLRPDEPQSYTDLAAVLARRIFRTIKGNTATSTRDSKLLATANEAMELYKQVIIKKWDVRWCQVELTALSEMSRLGHFVQWMGLDQSSMVNIDRRLVQSLMDLDLHVMIRWDTDLTDAEIVVTEPSGEVCNSFHNKTKTGMLSRNFTCGYGPQEYCVRTAQPGRYRIEVRLFGAPPAAPPTTVTVRVTTDWGRPVTQAEEYHVIRLSKVKEAVHVMDVNFKEL